VIRQLPATALVLALCAGCSGTFTSKAPVSRAYVLRPAPSTPADVGANSAVKPAFDGTLRVHRPNPDPGFETDRILLLRDGRELDFYATGHWAAPMPDMVEAIAIETLRGKPLFAGVYGESTPMRADFFLQITVRAFVAEYRGGADAPVARVVLDCTLGRRLDRSVIAAFAAEGSAPAAANRMGEVVAAYEAALWQAMGAVSESLAAAAK
jgi:ABC-type uncharacterized transport system auxiliary subunit